MLTGLLTLGRSAMARPWRHSVAASVLIVVTILSLSVGSADAATSAGYAYDIDNSESASSRGFVPHRIDMSSVSSDLQIIQRGVDPHHHEITPCPGMSLLSEDYAALLWRIRTAGGSP